MKDDKNRDDILHGKSLEKFKRYIRRYISKERYKKPFERYNRFISKQKPYYDDTH